MDVILLERVDKLGQMGDVVSVKDGFARNFLLPRKKALRATDANKKHFENQRAEIEAANLQKREEAEKVATKVEGRKIVLIRQAGESGQLYGSVNARDIAATLSDDGVSVQRGQIIQAQPIKTLGIFDVTVRLHPEVETGIVVNVARSQEEAEMQFETGSAFVGGPDDDDDDELDAETIVDELLDDEARVDALVDSITAEADRASGGTAEAADEASDEATNEEKAE